MIDKGKEGAVQRERFTPHISWIGFPKAEVCRKYKKGVCRDRYGPWFSKGGAAKAVDKNDNKQASNEAAALDSLVELCWDLFYAFVGHTGLTTSNCPLTCFSPAQLGMTTMYNFWAYPDNVRLRLSQILVLPPYQEAGLGKQMLQVLSISWMCHLETSSSCLIMCTLSSVGAKSCVCMMCLPSGDAAGSLVVC